MTDAEFLRFLRHGGSKIAVIVEIEYAYESAGTLATGTLYFSDMEDAVAGSQPYHAAIMKAPELERSIDLQRLGGRGSRTVGSIGILNSDGAFDFLLETILDGRDAEILIGGKGWARADYRTLCKGAVAAVSASSDEEIIVQLRDKNFLLDASIVGDEITTGPNAGKRKPILVGNVFNVDLTPYLYDTAGPSYYFNNFAGSSFRVVSDVRDLGLSLQSSTITGDNTAITANAGTDTISFTTPHGRSVNDVLVFNSGLGGIFAGLSLNTQYWVIAAGLTANDLRLSLTRGGAAEDITGTTFAGSLSISPRRYYVDATAGSLTLSAAPEGRVTMDYDHDPTFPSATDRTFPHNAFRYLLDTFTELSGSDRDDATFDALALAQFAGNAFWGRDVIDRANVIEILDEIAQDTLSWFCWRSDGVLTVGKLDLANLDSVDPVATLTAEADFIGELSSETLPIPFGKVLVDHGRNSAVQTDGLSAALTETQRALYSQKFRGRVTSTDPGTSGYLANWWDYHKSAIDSRPVASGLLFSPAAQALADDMAELFAPWTRVHRGVVGLDRYTLNPGDCVEVTYPRYGLDDGVNCRVISVRPRVSDREVDLVLVRQAIPDYTATH